MNQRTFVYIFYVFVLLSGGEAYGQRQYERGTTHVRVLISEDECWDFRPFFADWGDRRATFAISPAEGYNYSEYPEPAPGQRYPMVIVVFSCLNKPTNNWDIEIAVPPELEVSERSVRLSGNGWRDSGTGRTGIRDVSVEVRGRIPTDKACLGFTGPDGKEEEACFKVLPNTGADIGIRFFQSCTVVSGGVEENYFQVEISQPPNGDVEVRVSGGDIPLFSSRSSSSRLTTVEEHTVRFSPTNYGPSQKFWFDIPTSASPGTEYSFTATVIEADADPTVDDYTGTTRICAEDPDPALAVSPTELTVPQGESRPFTVGLDYSPGATRTVRMNIEADSPLDVNDLTLTPPSPLDFNNTRPREITVGADDEASPGTYRIKLNLLEYGDDPADEETVTVTVTGDEVCTQGVETIPDVTLARGGTSDITAALRCSSATAVTGTFRVSDSDGEATSDLTFSIGGTGLTDNRFTWGAGETSKTVRVTATSSANGRYTVTLEPSAGTSESFTVTVTESVTPSLVVEAGTTDETLWFGTTRHFTAKLSGKPSGNVTVNLTGSPAGGITFPPSLTFTPSVYEQRVNVTAVSYPTEGSRREGSYTITATPEGDGATGSARVNVRVERLKLVLPTNLRNGGSLRVRQGTTERQGFQVWMNGPPPVDADGKVQARVMSAPPDGQTDDITFVGDPATFARVNWRGYRYVYFEVPRDIEVGEYPIKIKVLGDDPADTYDWESEETGFTIEVISDPVCAAPWTVSVIPTEIRVDPGGEILESSGRVRFVSERTYALENLGGRDIDIEVSDPDVGLVVGRQAFVSDFRLSFNFVAGDEITKEYNLYVKTDQNGVTTPEGSYEVYFRGGCTTPVLTVHVAHPTIAGAEILPDPTALSLQPSDATGTVNVTLSHDPNSDVTITVEEEGDTDNAIKMISPSTLTFTNSSGENSYNMAQPITVTLEDDLYPTADNPLTANLKLYATGGGYQDADTVRVPVTVKWTPVANARIPTRPRSISLKPGGSEEVKLDLRPRSPRADVVVTLEPHDNETTDVNGETQKIVTLSESHFTFTKDEWDNDWDGAKEKVVTVTATEHATSGKTPEIRLTAVGGGYDRATGRIEVTILPPCEPAFASGMQSLNFGTFSPTSDAIDASSAGSATLNPRLTGSIMIANDQITRLVQTEASEPGRFQTISTECSRCTVTLKEVPTRLTSAKDIEPNRIPIGYELLWAQSKTDAGYKRIPDVAKGSSYTIKNIDQSTPYTHWFQVGGKIKGITQQGHVTTEICNGRPCPTDYFNEPKDGRGGTGVVVTLSCE